MKRAAMVVVVLVLNMAWILSSHAEVRPEALLRAVVKIQATIRDDARTAETLGKKREGNGVLIDAEGTILTIGYLVLEAKDISVVGPDGESVEADFVAYDHQTGFGLVRARNPIYADPMKLGSSSELEPGAPTLIAGHGGADAVKGAWVISRGVFTGYWEYLLERAIFVGPPFADFGGAALIGPKGQLLGIGSIFTQLQIQDVGIVPCNMFVPIDLLKPILTDLKTSGRPSSPPLPWLGIYADHRFGRVFVVAVAENGPAAGAGMQSGDVILAVNGQQIQGLADFYRKVWAMGEAGVDVPLRVLQGNEIRDLTIHSEDRYLYLRMAGDN